ncbi:MAG TPA: GNAT family N-acetyltransferase [Rhizomicrobium sp.]
MIAVIAVIEADRNDIAILAALHGACFEEAWPADAFDRLLAVPGTFALLARSEDMDVGFVLARFVADEAEILSVGVSAFARRRGIAAHLLAVAARHAAAGGAAKLFLEVGAENTVPLTLYRKLGFREAGRRRGYYRNGLADGLTMRADLPLGGLGKEPELD